MISNTFLSLARNVSSDGWSSEHSVNICSTSHLVHWSLFDACSKVLVWSLFLFLISSTQTHGCIPFIGIFSCLTISMLSGYWWCSLTKILWLSKYVLSHCFKVLNCLLDDDCFWEAAIDSFRVEWIACTSRHSSLRETEPMLILLYWPLILSALLFSRSKCTMSLVVHTSYFLFLLLLTTKWVQHIFSTFRTHSCYSKLELRVLHSTW